MCQALTWHSMLTIGRLSFLRYAAFKNQGFENTVSTGACKVLVSEVSMVSTVSLQILEFWLQKSENSEK